MAAFVAKQMVGNKLNAVKGEYFLRNRFHNNFILRSDFADIPSITYNLTNQLFIQIIVFS